MNFKLHVNYAIEKLASVGADCDLHYSPGCQELPPKKMIEEVSRDMESVKTKDGVWTRMTLSLISTHSQWARWGLNTFDPTASLTAGLMITTPTTEPGFPRMPYPTFFIRVPKGFLPFWESGSDTPQWIEGMLVCQMRSAGSDTPDSDGVLEIHLIGPGQGQNGSCERTLTLTLFEKTFTSPAKYVEIDDRLWDEPARPIEMTAGPHSEIVEVTNKDGITKRLAFRLLANLCSWLESIGGMKNRKPSNSPKKTKDSDGWDGLENGARIAQWIVGQEVKLSHELIESAKDHVLGLDRKQGRKGWSLHSMHTVRGHIRHQACGPHYSERKVIWIAPFVRGPAGGDILAHVYKAQEKERSGK